MASVAARVLLFLSSYSPLFVILGLLNVGNLYLSILFFLIAAATVVVLFGYLASYNDVVPYSVTLKSISSRDSDVMSYVVSYLVPFLGVSFTEVFSAVSFLIFIAVIGIIYVSSNMVYINPVLSLQGYHLFEVEDDEGKVSALICRRPYIPAGSKVDVVSIGDFAIMEKGKEQ